MKTRILLVDDDHVFGKLLKAQAQTYGVDLTYCSSVSELWQRGEFEKFDLILLDYNLGAVKGSTIAEILQLFFPETPVAMISSSSQWWLNSGDHYPTCIKSFIHKDHAHEVILKSALATIEQHRKDVRSGNYKNQCEPYPEIKPLSNAYRKTMRLCGAAVISGLNLIAK